MGTQIHGCFQVRRRRGQDRGLPARAAGRRHPRRVRCAGTILQSGLSQQQKQGPTLLQVSLCVWVCVCVCADIIFDVSLSFPRSQK